MRWPKPKKSLRTLVIDGESQLMLVLVFNLKKFHGRSRPGYDYCVCLLPPFGELSEKAPYIPGEIVVDTSDVDSTRLAHTILNAGRS